MLEAVAPLAGEAVVGGVAVGHERSTAVGEHVRRHGHGACLLADEERDAPGDEHPGVAVVPVCAPRGLVRVLHGGVPEHGAQAVGGRTQNRGQAVHLVQKRSPGHAKPTGDRAHGIAVKVLFAGHTCQKPVRQAGLGQHAGNAGAHGLPAMRAVPRRHPHAPPEGRQGVAVDQVADGLRPSREVDQAAAAARTGVRGRQVFDIGVGAFGRFPSVPRVTDRRAALAPQRFGGRQFGQRRLHQPLRRGGRKPKRLFLRGALLPG